MSNIIKPHPIMFKILPIMLLSSAQKLTHFAQIIIMPITTAIMSQFIYNFIIFNDHISIVGLQVIMFTLCYAALFLYLTYSIVLVKLVPHFVKCFHGYYTTKVL